VIGAMISLGEWRFMVLKEPDYSEEIVPGIDIRDVPCIESLLVQCGSCY